MKWPPWYDWKNVENSITRHMTWTAGFNLFPQTTNRQQTILKILRQKYGKSLLHGFQVLTLSQMHQICSGQLCKKYGKSLLLQKLTCYLKNNKCEAENVENIESIEPYSVIIELSWKHWSKGLQMLPVDLWCLLVINICLTYAHYEIHI